MYLSTIEKQVLNILRDENRRVTMKELLAKTYSNKRSIYMAVNTLIEKGAPIVAFRSSHFHGYLLARNKRDIEHGTAQFKKQIETEQRRVNQLNRIDLDNWQDDFAEIVEDSND